MDAVDTNIKIKKKDSRVTYHLNKQRRKLVEEICMKVELPIDPRQLVYMALDIGLATLLENYGKE